jgi:SAM-dependent methyltransferase
LLIHSQQLGGCEGYVSFALAKAFPSLRFIVQDLPNMRAPSLIHPIPEGLESRVELTVHSYFDPQPVTADVYFYRQCFHNNSDKYAIQMLQALIPALKPGAKILINDVMLPEPGVLRPEDEKNVRVMDIMMSVTFNARERALQDWKDLFTLADKRFSFVGAKQLAGKLWIMEAEWNA